MKKTLSFIMALCFIFLGATIKSSAVNTNTNTFFFENNKEVYVYGEDIDQEKKQSIAHFISNVDEKETNDISPRGILCIFGHKLATTTATEITHNAYSSSPKCLEKKYKVEYCTRSSCDYMTKELVDSIRISACHG